MKKRQSKNRKADLQKAISDLKLTEKQKIIANDLIKEILTKKEKTDK